MFILDCFRACDICAVRMFEYPICQTTCTSRKNLGWLPSSPWRTPLSLSRLLQNPYSGKEGFFRLKNPSVPDHVNCQKPRSSQLNLGTNAGPNAGSCVSTSTLRFLNLTIYEPWPLIFLCKAPSHAGCWSLQWQRCGVQPAGKDSSSIGSKTFSSSEEHFKAKLHLISNEWEAPGAGLAGYEMCSQF